MALPDTTRFTTRALWRVLDGRAYLLDGKTGEHFETNAVGGRIFQLAAEGRTLAEIRAALLAELDVDGARLERDLATYVDELIREGMLAVAGEAR
jgi:hypothetical protein